MVKTIMQENSRWLVIKRNVFAKEITPAAE
jgi:hypothetical protein